MLGDVGGERELACQRRPVVDHPGDGREDAVVDAAVRGAVLEPQLLVGKRLGAPAVGERAVEPKTP